MTHDEPQPIPGWQYGLDPQAEGLAIRSFTRERHRLGEALRIEQAPLEGDSRVHVQWYITTRMGPWAMWTACRPEDLAAHEAVLHEVDWFGLRPSGEPLALAVR